MIRNEPERLQSSTILSNCDRAHDVKVQWIESFISPDKTLFQIFQCNLNYIKFGSMFIK